MLLLRYFPPFFFANHDTKTPFYVSLISVFLNIFISVYFFKNVGFLIIPIATSVSSWFNSLLLFIYLRKKRLFKFSNEFFLKLLKIIIASLFMGVFFNYLTLIFENKLMYDYRLKALYLILSVLLGLLFYILISFLIRAFNYKDLQLKY